jgi:hypothetical protein
MTTEDKTGDKLVASIRKTKTGSAGAAQADAAKPATAPSPKKTVAKRTTTSSSASKSTTDVAQYQTKGRVWPD